MVPKRAKTNTAGRVSAIYEQLSIDSDNLDSYLKKFCPSNRWVTLGSLVFNLLLFPLGVIYLYGKIELWATGLLTLIYVLLLATFISEAWKCQVRKLQIKQIRACIKSTKNEGLNPNELTERVSFLDEEEVPTLIEELKREEVLVSKSERENKPISNIGG